MLRPLLITIALFCVPSFLTAAETPIGFRQLVTTYPPVVQRGTTAEIEVRSNYTLDDSYAVFFDKPGIVTTFLEAESKEAPYRGRGTPGVPFRFSVEVPEDQEPGVRELRVATRHAVSSVSHLLVTEFPVVLEDKKPHNTPETAQEVPVPVAIAGICERNEEVDYYRFAGKAGQELTIQIYAQRVTDAIHSMQSGSVYHMDALLTLHGPHGQIVAVNDNFIGGDSLIDVTLPSDGDYVLEVRDSRYVGNAKYVYCVEIGDRPYAHAVFPMAVERGTSAEVEIVGHGLGDSQTATVTSSDDEEIGWTTRRLETSRGQTNPVSLLVSEHPQVVCPGVNDSLDSAMPITIPSGVNGRFLEPDDVHYYAFEAKKGRLYLFETESNRHGLPLDTVLEMYDADGKRLAEADDGLQTKDSRMFFTAPADGPYYLAVRDLHGRGGDRFIYHLRAEESGPDFEVHGEYYYAQLAPGTNMMWFVKLNRLNGFKEPVEIHIDGLPEGVTITPVTIPGGMSHCAVILRAAEDAEIGASLVRLYGKAELPQPDGSTKEAIRYGRITAELQSRGGAQASWPIQTQLVGVTEPLDLVKVEAGPEEVVLEPGKKAEITVRIERKDGFEDPVTLAMSFDYFARKIGEQLPPGVKMASGSQGRLSGKNLEGKIILEAEKNALPVERLPIGVLARVSITFSITTNYSSNPLYLTIPAADAKTAQK